MNKKNTAIGVILILLGISIYLKNFHIGTGTLTTLFLGFGLLFAYYIKRDQPFMIFGGIFTGIGIMSILKDIRLFRMDFTFETALIALGIIFILLYYSKHVQGFIFPGAILPALGIYSILVRSFSDKYVSSSIFLLLGFAFYTIYFLAYMGKSAWPLVPATVLLLAGIISYAFSFEIIKWNMFYLNWDYTWPLLMVAAGLLILISKIKRRS
jgi:hypothetical protein